MLMPDSFEPGRDRDRDRDWDRDRDRGRKSRMTDDDRDRSRDRFRDESPEDHEGEPKSKMDRIFSQLKTMNVAVDCRRFRRTSRMRPKRRKSVRIHTPTRRSERSAKN